MGDDKLGPREGMWIVSTMGCMTDTKELEPLTHEELQLILRMTEAFAVAGHDVDVMASLRRKLRVD